MNNQQRFAIECAVIDLVHALDVAADPDPMNQLNSDALVATLEDLQRAFPELADWIEDVYTKENRAALAE
jgi:hypothetical protein